MTTHVRQTLRVLGTLLAACIAGCADGASQAASKDTSTPPTTAGSPTAGSAMLSRVPKKMPKKWRDVVNPADLKTYIDEVEAELDPALGHTTSFRNCLDPSGKLQEHVAECNLQIIPVKGAVLIAREDADTLGRIIAKIVNIGVKMNWREDLLRIPNGETAYWLVVEEDGGFRSVFLNAKTPNKPFREMSYARCRHDPNHPENLVTKAKFQCCGGACPAGRDEHTSPPWITCAQGCCYAS
jgi:hypothetical protein